MPQILQKNNKRKYADVKQIKIHICVELKILEYVLNVDSGSKIVEPVVANHGETKDTRYSIFIFLSVGRDYV